MRDREKGVERKREGAYKDSWKRGDRVIIYSEKYTERVTHDRASTGYYYIELNKRGGNHLMGAENHPRSAGAGCAYAGTAACLGQTPGSYGTINK